MKSFREFFSDELITESPRIDSNLTKSNIRASSKFLKQVIKDNHNNSTKIGDDTYYQKSPTHHLYYRYKNGRVKECSAIDNKNTHVFSDKGSKGSSEHIKRFVEHHARNHGFVGSDKINTKGSENFWKSFSENIPDGMTLYHVHNNQGNIESNTATPEYMRANRDKIWGEDSKYENHRIILHKNEK